MLIIIQELWKLLEKSHILFLQMGCLTEDQYSLKCEKERQQTHTNDQGERGATPCRFGFGLSSRRPLF